MHVYSEMELNIQNNAVCTKRGSCICIQYIHMMVFLPAESSQRAYNGKRNQKSARNCSIVHTNKNAVRRDCF